MRNGVVFWGIVLVGAGVLLLLGNLGMLPFNPWSIIGPSVLILAGIWIVWSWAFRGKLKVEHVVVPLEGAAQAHVYLNHAAGRLRLSAGEEMGDLLEGDFKGGVEAHIQREGDLLDVRLKMRSRWAGPFPGEHERLDWNIRLNPEVALQMELDSGANDARMDLSQLQVSDLKVKSGASSTELILPAAAGFTRVNISCGAASVRVTVPVGVAASIRSGGGISSVSIDERRFPRSAGVYQSADYASAPNRVEVMIDVGVGAVEVR
jgi:hypothetical protein